MPNVDILRKEHADLEVIGGRLAAAIAKDAPSPIQVLYALRMEFASALIHHLKSEDWALYPRLLVSRDKRVAETAHTFKEEMGGLAKAFREYAEQWGPHAIMGDWKRYQRETGKILQALMQRMIRENRDLYPLLESPERVAPPTGVGLAIGLRSLEAIPSTAQLR